VTLFLHLATLDPGVQHVARTVGRVEWADGCGKEWSIKRGKLYAIQPYRRVLLNSPEVRQLHERTLAKWDGHVHPEASWQRPVRENLSANIERDT